MTCYAYILVSHENNNYAAMCLISALSVRGVDPEAQIIVLSDGPTVAMLKQAKHQLLEVADEVRDCQVNEPPKIASRILKTTMLQRLQCDFIFLDVDTIVVKPIAERLSLPESLQLVPDRNALYPVPGFPEWVTPYYKELDWVYPTRSYFNSGVMFVRANQATEQLFEEWHTRWRAFTKLGKHYDQPALNSAIEATQIRVKTLPVQYNAMVRVDESYRWRARILHFFAEGNSLDAGTEYAALAAYIESGQKLTAEQIRAAIQRRWPLVEPWSLKRHIKAGSLRGALRRLSSAFLLLPKRDWQGFLQRFSD